MTRVYAKTASFLYHFFLAAVIALTLSACSGGTGYNFPSFGLGGTGEGVVTNDPDSLPDVAWQTNGQRQELRRPGLETVKGPADIPQRKVSVALLLPLTGKNADLGQSMLKAAQLALFDVGSNNFSLEPQDTQSTPAGAAAAARTAVAAKADLILGPIFADDVRAVKAAVGGSGTPVIAFTNDWSLGGSNTYIMGFMPVTQVTRVARYAQSHGYDSFGVFAPQTPYCDSVIDTLQRSGARIVETGRYAPSQTDLLTTVGEFVARSQPVEGSAALSYKALMLPIGGENLNAVAATFSQKGVTNKTVRFIGTGLWDDEALSRNPAIHGGWFAAPDPALRRDFEKRYQENYGAAAPRLASLAYDATAMSAVLARNVSGDPYSRSVLTNPRGFAGVDGVFRFRADGLSERGLAVLEIQGGRPRIIDPAPTAFIAPGM